MLRFSREEDAHDLESGVVIAGLPGSFVTGLSLDDDFVALRREGIVFDEARVRITQRFKHFTGPGRVFIGKTMSSKGRFIVSRSRIYACGWASKTIDIPCHRGNIGLYSFDRRGDKLTIAIPDVSAVMGASFRGDFSVTVHSDKAAQLLSYFDSLREPGRS